MATRSKGDGSIYQMANGRWRGSIEAGWKDGKRIRRTATGKTRTDVSRKLGKIRAELEAGMVANDATLGDWIDHWRAVICPERGLKPSTLYAYDSYIKQWIKPQLGKVKLKALTADHVRKLHQAMREAGKSAASIRQAHAILSRALKVAEREGKVRRNVAALVDVPSPGASHHGELTTAQAKKVMQAAQGDRRLVARLAVALILGLRQGEALALRWSDLDLTAQEMPDGTMIGGTLEVSEGLTIIRGEGPRLTGVKSVASRRLIPLPLEVAVLLDSWRIVATDPEWVFPSLRTGHGPETDPRADWQRWKDALERAGVPHVPLHGARATAASVLMERGVPDRVTADILGHAQVATTRKHYLRSQDTQRLAGLAGVAGELLG